MIRGQHHAIATPGDIVFHIRAARMDLCFELATQIMAKLEGAVTAVDEVHGFRYFDSRDLLGFVDGTANPTGLDLPASALVGDEDGDFAGGSYVVVQKYLHDVAGWNAENHLVIGRNVKPGQQIQLAIFGINGPLSAGPANFLWFREAKIEFFK